MTKSLIGYGCLRAIFNARRGRKYRPMIMPALRNGKYDTLVSDDDMDIRIRVSFLAVDNMSPVDVTVSCVTERGDDGVESGCEVAFRIARPLDKIAESEIEELCILLINPSLSEMADWLAIP